MNTDVRITARSHLAPLWLIFPKDIFNTRNVTRIEKIKASSLVIHTIDGHSHTIFVKDIDSTFSALQKVFAEGIVEEQNHNSSTQ